MSDESTDMPVEVIVETEAPPSTKLWGRSPRSLPWLSVAIAGMLGVVLLQSATTIGGDSSQTWGAVTTWIAVVAAYLVEYKARRVVSAACTAIIALGIPVGVAMSILPIHTYNGFRTIVLLTIAAWIAVFAVGGTRGRAIFLGFALFGIWMFAVLEMGHVQDTARVLRNAIPFAGQLDSGLTTGFPNDESFADEPGCSIYLEDADGALIFDDNGEPAINTECENQFDAFAEPKPLPDYSLGIGLTSLLIGTLYLGLLRRSDGGLASAVGTAFVVPATIALTTGYIALGIKWDMLWLIGFMMMAYGIGIGVIGSRRRRFTSWLGALTFVLGLTIFTTDVTEQLFDSNSRRTIGITTGLMALLALSITWLVSTSVPESDEGATS